MIIFTADWALQTALTAAIAGASGYGATRLAAHAFDVGKKQGKGQAVITTCPLQGCLTCSSRNNGHKAETLVGH